MSLEQVQTLDDSAASGYGYIYTKRVGFRVDVALHIYSYSSLSRV